jgi:DNA repair protein RadC
MSGSPEPSNEHIEITHRLREVAETIGVRVLEHITSG